jgi:hypothetical protein
LAVDEVNLVVGGSGKGAGRVMHGDLQIQKYLDKASSSSARARTAGPNRGHCEKCVG